MLWGKIRCRKKKRKKKETLKNWRVPSWQGLFARYQNQFCGFQNLAMPKLYGTSNAWPYNQNKFNHLFSIPLFCMKLVLIPVAGSLYVFLLRPAPPILEAYFSTLSQPIEIAGMLHVLERTQALCKSFRAKNQIKMKFLQHFLSSCVVFNVFTCACLYLCVSSASLEYTKDRHSCNTISEFKGMDFGRRRRFLLRRFCILQIMGPRSHLDSMWSQFAWDTSDKAKEPRRVARAKDMENFKEELHTGPWHIELLRECTQGWFRSP